MIANAQSLANSLFELPNTRPTIKVVQIPAGNVCLGTSDYQIVILQSESNWPRDEWGDFFREEQPQHTVHVPAFGIGLTPVTNAQYLAFVEATGTAVPRVWPGLIYPEGQAEYPIVAVSWHSARAYCAWLSEVTGLTCRLPTEAEWERAARGDDSRTYPWGNDFNPFRVNTAEAFTRGPTPVHLHSPASDSPFGVMNLSGNVWEWTSSRLMPYPYDPAGGREDPQAPGLRVVRGGAWMYSRRLARCAVREGAPPDISSNTTGFRIAIGGG